MHEEKQIEVETGTSQEIGMCKLWCKARGTEYIQAPTYEDFDFFITKRGMLDHFLEIRTRDIKHDEYDLTMIPLRKYLFATNMMRSGYKTYALIKWSDIIGYIELYNKPQEIKLMTRADRDETNPYALFHISKIIKLT